MGYINKKVKPLEEMYKEKLQQLYSGKLSPEEIHKVKKEMSELYICSFYEKPARTLAKYLPIKPIRIQWVEDIGAKIMLGGEEIMFIPWSHRHCVKYIKQLFESEGFKVEVHGY